jgi:hypothetical protein
MVILFILLWIIAGFAAFMASIICLFRKSSISDKFLGLLLALLFGPFYWIYFMYNNAYCN